MKNLNYFTMGKIDYPAEIRTRLKEKAYNIDFNLKENCFE
jgi:hypothetical protein